MIGLRQTKREIYWNRCDECGRFIPMEDFESGSAHRSLCSVDSDYSSEAYTTLCAKHNKQKN